MILQFMSKSILHLCCFNFSFSFPKNIDIEKTVSFLLVSLQNSNKKIRRQGCKSQKLDLKKLILVVSAKHAFSKY